MGSSKTKDFTKKHPVHTEVNENIKQEILSQTKNKGLPCAVAFVISEETGAPIAEVGKTADLIPVKLTKCQLGLFGYGPEKKRVNGNKAVEPDLKKRILGHVSQNRISCQIAWEIAASSGVPKIRVGDACEAMNVKIVPCQLGAF